MLRIWIWVLDFGFPVLGFGVLVWGFTFRVQVLGGEGGSGQRPTLRKTGFEA